MFARLENRLVDASQRGGADRDRVESLEDILDRPAEIALQNGDGFVGGDRRHIVKQLAQLVAKSIRQQVGAHRKLLPDFDHAGAGPLEQSAEPDCAALDGRTAKQGVERVAENVCEGDCQPDREADEGEYNSRFENRPPRHRQRHVGRLDLVNELAARQSPQHACLSRARRPRHVQLCARMLPAPQPDIDRSFDFICALRLHLCTLPEM